MERGTLEYVRALAENERRRAEFDGSTLPRTPRRRLAVLACMDARLTIEDVLGLHPGDAHVIRNAGGLATDDALRSLVISHQLLGTEEVIVVAHTACGMLTLREDELRADLADKTGTAVDLPFLAFAELESNLRVQVERIRSHPWITEVPVHGLIYEVESGVLREVI